MHDRLDCRQGVASGTRLSRLPTKKPAADRGQEVEPLIRLGAQREASIKRHSLGCGSEVRIGLHAVLADVETFDLFLFSDTNATE